MLLLSYLIRYFFKQQIFFVKHWDWYIGSAQNLFYHLLSSIRETHRFSLPKQVK